MKTRIVTSQQWDLIRSAGNGYDAHVPFFRLPPRKERVMIRLVHLLSAVVLGLTHAIGFLVGAATTSPSESDGFFHAPVSMKTVPTTAADTAEWAVLLSARDPIKTLMAHDLVFKKGRSRPHPDTQALQGAWEILSVERAGLPDPTPVGYTVHFKDNEVHFLEALSGSHALRWEDLSSLIDLSTPIAAMKVEPLSEDKMRKMALS
jgi:hypothetical protein